VARAPAQSDCRQAEASGDGGACGLISAFSAATGVRLESGW
jgi:hypothetical protein